MSEKEAEFQLWWKRQYLPIDLENDPLRKADMYLAWMEGARWAKEMLNGD